VVPPPRTLGRWARTIMNAVMTAPKNSVARWIMVGLALSGLELRRGGQLHADRHIVGADKKAEIARPPTQMSTTSKGPSLAAPKNEDRNQGLSAIRSM